MRDARGAHCRRVGSPARRAPPARSPTPCAACSRPRAPLSRGARRLPRRVRCHQLRAWRRRRGAHRGGAASAGARPGGGPHGEGLVKNPVRLRCSRCSCLLALLVAGLSMLVPDARLAATRPRPWIERAVEAYRAGLDTPDRDQRLEAFRRSARLFADAAEKAGGSADLYANLGNAALQGPRISARRCSPTAARCCSIPTTPGRDTISSTHAAWPRTGCPAPRSLHRAAGQLLLSGIAHPLVGGAHADRGALLRPGRQCSSRCRSASAASRRAISRSCRRWPGSPSRAPWPSIRRIGPQGRAW